MSDPRLTRLIDICKLLEERKVLYAEYDTIVVELASEGFASALVDDMVLELKDNFANGNVGWTSAAVKRFEVTIEAKEDHDRKAAKRAKKEAKS
jgi:hypothetical protein